MDRGLAYSRAQRQRAQARAHHMVVNIWRCRADNPLDEWDISPERVEQLKRMYSVDRALSRKEVRGEHRQERQAAADEREQRSFGENNC